MKLRRKAHILLVAVRRSIANFRRELSKASAKVEAADQVTVYKLASHPKRSKAPRHYIHVAATCLRSRGRCDCSPSQCNRRGRICGGDAD